MVTIEEESHYMTRIHREKLIKRIISEKFILLNYKIIDNVYTKTWQADIYKLKWHIIPQHVGFVYPSDCIYFKCIVIGGDPDLFKDTAEKLEQNGIEVTIQKPIS